MSLTTGERQALQWLLAVLSIGAVARVVSARGERAADSPAATESLRRQLASVDSAQRSERRPVSRSGRATRRSAERRTGPEGDSIAPGIASTPQVPTLTLVDVDQADSAALERLPRIGPSLAARIVADRQKKGAFGSASGLQRVRGIGPKLAALLAPLVTFSGTPRPPVAQR